MISTNGISHPKTPERKCSICNQPDVLLNLAAMTDVDGCEDKTALAEKSNVEGPEVLAGLCRASRVKLIHISTDYVFDGRKSSRVPGR